MTRRAEAGFTLIEILVVAFLFTLFSALAFSDTRQALRKRGEQTVTGDVLSTLSFARDRAIVERMAYGVRFSPASQSYRILRSSQLPDLPDYSYELLPDQWGHSQRLPSTVSMMSPETLIRFYPDGTSKGERIAFDFSGRAMELSVNAVTGKGEFHEPS